MLIRSTFAFQLIRIRKTALCLFSFLLMTGCVANQSVQQIDQLESIKENPRVVLMPPDIRYYLLTAGGVAEPNAEWTDAAIENFGVAVQDYADSIGTDLKLIDKNDLSRDEIRYETLHSAVGLTILQNHFGMLKLPSKGGSFDWSLGPEIKSIANERDADYALFVYYRDYQASGGRVAFAILAAAAGSSVNTGSEQGFASLVDLRSGEIVWFNVVNDGGGELRDKGGAAAAVDALFRDIPVAQDNVIPVAQDDTG
jgi:hypothetical protein